MNLNCNARWSPLSKSVIKPKPQTSLSSLVFLGAYYGVICHHHLTYHTYHFVHQTYNHLCISLVPTPPRDQHVPQERVRLPVLYTPPIYLRSFMCWLSARLEIHSIIDAAIPNVIVLYSIIQWTCKTLSCSRNGSDVASIEPGRYCLHVFI